MMTLDDLGERLFCDVPEVARITGRDERTVRESIKSGQIPGTQIGKQYVVPTSWLRELASPVPEVAPGLAAPEMEHLADLVADRLVARLARILAPGPELAAAV